MAVLGWQPTGVTAASDDPPISLNAHPAVGGHLLRGRAIRRGDPEAGVEGGLGVVGAGAAGVLVLPGSYTRSGPLRHIGSTCGGGEASMGVGAEGTPYGRGRVREASWWRRPGE